MYQSVARRRDTPEIAPAIAVLIVDDSAVARAALGRIVEASDALTLAGTVPSAPAATAWLSTNRADVVLLDLEMPGQGGLDALPELLISGRGAQVLIVSSTAREGAEATMRALALGAADTLAKPGAGHLNQRFGDVLVDRICRLGRSRNVARSERFVLRPLATRPVELLAVGASTGGIRALGEFFTRLPRSFSAPIVVTQHLPPSFMPYFADQLAAMANRFARVATEGARLRAGEVLVAPGTQHLTVERVGTGYTVRLTDEVVASRCCPSVDPMFASVAVAGEGAAAVVLTGMGRDGTEGAARIIAEGGSVIAQDRASSAVWGMPGCIAREGLASLVAAPADLARHLAERGSA